MLLQTNSYFVPAELTARHADLMGRFRAVMRRLGCESFEVYEQLGADSPTGAATGRFVQIMRFRDRMHQQKVQTLERTDPAAQAIIREFCDLVDLRVQRDQGLFATSFYHSSLPEDRTAPVQQASASVAHQGGRL